jgi:hypothetical protein
MSPKSRKKDASPKSRSGATIWLTRAQAAARLGLTVSGVRGRVGLRLLKEYRDDRGTARYDAAEVDKMAKERPAGGAKADVAPGYGELAATAFQMFDRSGVDVRRAVVELRIPTEVAERLAAEYGRAGSEVVLKVATIKDVRRLLGDRHPELPMNDALLPQLVIDYAQRIAREREDAGRRYEERLKAERDVAAKQRAELEEALKTATDERDAVFATLAAITAKINAAADSRSGEVPASVPRTAPVPPVAPTTPGEEPVPPASVASPAPTPGDASAATPGEEPAQPVSASRTAVRDAMSGAVPVPAGSAPLSDVSASVAAAGIEPGHEGPSGTGPG